MHTGFWFVNVRERVNLEVPRSTCEDNIKLYGRVGMDQIDLVQDRDRWWAHAKAVINNCVPYYVEKILTSGETVRFSRRTLLHGVRKYVSK